MKSNSRVLRGWRDFGVKATAIILTILLATQMVGTPAFASGALTNKQASEDIATTVDDTGVEPSGTEATDTTVPDEAAGAANEPAPADSTQATEEPVVETVESATEPATETPAADPAANTVLGAEPEPAPAPAVEQDQLASIKLNLADGASITLSKDGNKIDDDTNPVDVPVNEELKFTAQAAEGWQIDKVKTVIDGVETELTADANGEYAVAAENVTDALTVKVESSEVATADDAAEAIDETEAVEEGPTVVEAEEVVADVSSPAFEGYAYVDDVVVKVTAGEGVLPEGTTVEAYRVDRQDVVEAVAAAIEQQGLIVESTLAIDVTLYDRDGEAIQPDGAVNVCFFNTGITGSEIDVYRVSDDASTVEAVSSRQADPDIQSFDVDHFTIYVVGGSMENSNADGSNNSRYNYYDALVGTTIYLASDSARDYWGIEYGSTRAEITDSSDKTAAVQLNSTGKVTVKHYNLTTGWWGESETDIEYYYINVVNSTNVKITYNRNGAVGSAPSAVTQRAGTTITLPDAGDMEKSGYTFVGWSTDSNATGAGKEHYLNTIYPGESEYTVPASNVTLYAVWAENSVDANFYIRLDGQIPTEPGGYDASEYSSPIYIRNAIRYASFYTFTGEGGVASRLYSLPTDDQIKNAYSAYDPNTQYVLWYVIKQESDSWHVDGVVLDKTKVTLSYDANGAGVTNMPGGAEFAEGTQVSAGKNYNGSSQELMKPVRNGYAFTGWNTKSDGTGTSYAHGQEFALNENTVLYAQWKSEIGSLEASGYEGVYDGFSHTVTVTGTIAGDEIEYYNALGEKIDNSFTDVADSQEVTIKVYRDGEEIWEETVDVTITQRPVTFTGNSGTVAYTGSEQSVTGFTTNQGGETGLVAGHTSNVEASAKGTVAGSYPGDITAKDDVVIEDADGNDVTANYDITVTGRLSITKAGSSQFTGAVTLDDWTYGDEAKAEQPSVTPEGSDYLAPSYTYKKATDGDDAWTAVKPTDAGDYVVKATWAATENCDEISATDPFTIEKRDLDVYAEDSRVYNGSDQTLDITAGDITEDCDGLADGQQLNIDASITGKDVADYTTLDEGAAWTVTVTEGGEDVTANYDITVTGRLSITKAGSSQFTGAVTLDDWTYGDEAKAEQPSVTPEGSDYLAPSYTYKKATDGDDAWTAVKPTDAGDYVVKATWAATENCDEISATDPFTIEKRPVSATGSATKVYDGTDALLGNVDLTLGTTALSESGVVEGDDVSATAIAQDAAKYASADAHENEPLVAANGGELIALTGLAGEKAANYELVSVTATGTITKQTIDPGTDPDNPDPSYANVVVSEPDDVTYNGQHQQSPVTVTRVDGEGNVIATLLEKVDYTLTYANDVNAGVETATVTVKGVGNYKGEVVKHYTINKADAVITVNDDSKEYGDNDPAFTGAVTLTDGSPLYINALTGVVDIIGDVTYSRTNSDEDADTYPGVLTATVANANGNYTYTVEPGDFTISRAGDNNVTIETAVEDRSKTYDGQPITIDATATESGSTLWYSTDGENWTETKPSLTNVGSLTIYVKATNPNFEDSAVVNATVQVTPRPVTFTTDSAAKIFDGVMLTAEAYEITSGSFVEGETYGVDFGDSGQTAAGQSANDATVVFAGENNEYTAQSGNYNVTVVPGKLTVYPQSIDPNDPDPDNPDPEDPDPTDPDPENPDQPFYNGVKVTAPEDVYYNGLSQEQAPVVTDRDGNPIDPSYYDVTYSEDTVNVGTVTITVSGKNGYTGSTQVTYNILKVDLTIATPSAGKVYDGTPLQNQIVTAEGWQDNDGSQVTLTATGSITNVGSAYNTYTVSDPDGVLNNYNVIDNLGVLTVWPQSIDPTDPGDDPDPEDPTAPDPSDPDPDFPDYDPTDPDPEGPDPDQPFYTGATVDDPESFPYDGNEHQWTPTVTDNEGNTLTPGEDYMVSYSTDDFTNVGTITVTITGTGNYGGSVEKTYQITPAQIVVNIENQTKVQGSADPTFTFNYSGVVEGETMAWTGEFVREVGEAVGDYAVMQGGFVLADNPEGNFDASNYTLVVNPGTLTITAATTPVVPDTPDTPDTPTPLPTPDAPTPVPTPVPGGGGATPTDGLTATTGDEAEEAIDDEATPLTAPEPIDDDATPLAANEHRDCWVHWLMLLGILVTVVYYGGVGVRRVRFSSSLQSFEDDVLGNDETNR